MAATGGATSAHSGARENPRARKLYQKNCQSTVDVFSVGVVISPLSHLPVAGEATVSYSGVIYESFGSANVHSGH